MGNQRLYKNSGGFKGYLYETQSAKVTINGVTGKIVKLKNDKDGNHSNLPQFADTSDMYFKRGKNGKVIQGRVYIDRRMTIDFDWGHDHRNQDGTAFKKGIVHVQVSSTGLNGNVVRNSKNARSMTNEEIKKYGSIINYFAPEARFR